MKKYLPYILGGVAIVLFVRSWLGNSGVLNNDQYRAGWEQASFGEKLSWTLEGLFKF